MSFDFSTKCVRSSRAYDPCLDTSFALYRMHTQAHEMFI